ncbi:hypothetical protein QNI16_32950 [Cytophagaceae bacterium YF14B1]|uniref:Uncharacterized protein n=1 Tax=Xanthocytophaga flava TaxID=3048013 RepID=A0AAE3QTU0_9BACT|nr:hypothetical protein [Xanthocytophaga flavus]MDJ1485347.1 hypothetical protein [Xanthocytophaga flavus]
MIYQIPVNNSVTKGFESTALKDVRLVAFKSLKEIQKNTRLAFKVVVYTYKSTHEANNTFQVLRTSLPSQSDLLFSKDWNLVVIKDNYLYKLNGGCLYSQQAWNELKTMFLKNALALKTNTGITNSFEIPCGGL